MKKRILNQTPEHLQYYFEISPVVNYLLKVKDGGEIVPVWVSKNIEDFLGYAMEEVLQPDWWINHLHPDDRSKAQNNLSALFKTGFLTHEYRFLRKDGKVVWIRDQCKLIRDKNGKPKEIVGGWMDITHEKENELKILEQMQILSSLYQSAQQLAETLDMEEVAKNIVKTCIEVFGLSLAWIGYKEPDGRVVPLYYFPETSSYLKEINVRWDDTPEGQGPTGRCIRTGKPQVTHNVEANSRYVLWKEAALKAGFLSSAAIPLISKGKVFGALNLYSAQPEYFTEERIKILQIFANYAATALKNASLHRQTEERLRRITALRNIDLAIAGSIDPRITYKIALDEVINQLKVDAAAILKFNQYTQTLECVVHRGFRTNYIEKSFLRLGEGPAGRAAAEHKVIKIDNLQESQEFLRKQLIEGEDFVTYYAAPMIAKGKLLGILEIYHRSTHEGNGEWLNFLEMLAGQIAIAIDNAYLYSDLERKRMELVFAYDQTIEGWARALALKEDETEQHSQRVTEMTVRIARAMGMSDEELVHVRRAALLHDIGKIGIPDSILLKPGKLTEEEWAIMRKHPVYAYELEPIAYLRPAIDIPYCHHEKWDGKGYPRGLKGEQIPLAARIFSIVDVWDALTSDRPYRKAWPKEKVIEYIKSESGKSFDPKIVDVFLKLIEEDSLSNP